MPRVYPDHLADEDYTEREAWTWLCEEAVNPRSYQSGGRRITLRPGQVAHSLRYMAGAWGWPVSRVRRFLKRLKDGGAIAVESTGTESGTASGTESGTASETRLTVVTICNFDRYIGGLVVPGRASGTESGTASGTESGTKKESIEKIGGGGGGGGDARAREAFRISKEAETFACELARIAGHDPDCLPPVWLSAGPEVVVQCWLNAGFGVGTMRAAARGAMARRRGDPPSSPKYFHRIFERAHSPQLPLAAKPKEAYRAQAFPASDFRTRRDAQHAARAELKSYLQSARSGAGEGEADQGGAGGGPAVRLVRDA